MLTISSLPRLVTSKFPALSNEIPVGVLKLLAKVVFLPFLSTLRMTSAL